MKKIILAGLISLTATSVFAKTYVCHFTEPFLTVKYRVGFQALTVSGPDLKTSLNLNVERVTTTDGSLVMIIDTQGNSILNMKLTGQGSDGMSDTLYPFEGRYTDKTGQTHIGGCDLKKGLGNGKSLVVDSNNDGVVDSISDDGNGYDEDRQNQEDGRN